MTFDGYDHPGDGVRARQHGVMFAYLPPVLIEEEEREEVLLAEEGGQGIAAYRRVVQHREACPVLDPARELKTAGQHVLAGAFRFVFGTMVLLAALIGVCLLLA
jgi:hypothetical protein